MMEQVRVRVRVRARVRARVREGAWAGWLQSLAMAPTVARALLSLP